MKREILFTASLEANCTLKEALETLSVEDLRDICFNIQLAEEASGEREYLMAHILENLPKSIQRFAMSFDTERYQLFQTMLEAGGCICADKVSIRKIMTLQGLGLAFPGLQGEERVLVIPQEVQQLLQAMDQRMWEEMAKYNTKLLERAQGALQLYGFLETSQLIRLCVGSIQEDPWDDIYFLEVLYDAVLYYGRIEPEEDGFRHKRFWNYAYICNRQKEFDTITENKFFSVEKLQRVGKLNGIEWTLPMERLKHFLVREGKITKSLAKREVEAAWYELNNGIPFDDVCHYLMDWYFSLATTDVQESLSFYVWQMFLTMPQWLLKGHSYDSLDEVLKIKQKEPKLVEIP